MLRDDRPGRRRPGLRVTFVIDATATNPIAHRDAPRRPALEEILADPRTLAAADVITRTEYALAGRFATIATVPSWPAPRSTAGS